MDIKIGSLKGWLLTMVAQEGSQRDTSSSKHRLEKEGAGQGGDGWRDRDGDELEQMSKVRQRTDRQRTDRQTED